MDVPPPGSGTSDEDVPRRLVDGLRAALVPVLTQGSWGQIQDDHKKVGLPWRADLEPGWGKPKYVDRVLEALTDAEVVALGRRAIDRFPDRCAFAVEDAMLWIDAGGDARVSEVTRVKLAEVLEGRRLHPHESPSQVLNRFASSGGSQHFEYSTDGRICIGEVDILSLFTPGASTNRTLTASTHLKLLDAYGFREWPDAKLFRMLEFLVHPTVRQGEDQAELVEALNGPLAADLFCLAESGLLSGHPVLTIRSAKAGVLGRPKNLIFASTGPKPELGFVDAVNNDITILRHGEHCLVYDEPINDSGLRWPQLVDWWGAREGLEPAQPSTRRSLAGRLLSSLGSPPERRLFNAYFKEFHPRLGEALPALIPQVYLHYDPMTLRELRARGEQRRFEVQRMDFLLLLRHRVRVVIEVDGQQHYSTGIEASARPSPKEYARTARSDRNLRLMGYEVYRFGGYELRDDASCLSAVGEFFTALFRRHQLLDAALRAIPCDK